MDERVLLLAPRGRDAEVIFHLLTDVGFTCEPSADLPALVANLEKGAATAIITEEALAAADEAPLTEWLERQPPWSDFPFVILVTKQAGRRSASAADRLDRIGNVVLLERPLNAETLISAAQSALRARRRQYQARNQMAEQAEAEATLRFALDGGRLGTWDLDLSAGDLHASKTFKQNFGRSVDDPFTFEDLLASIHPDDRDRPETALRRSLVTGQDFDIEYRTIWPNGEMHWVYIRGGRTAQLNGKAGRLTGVSLDITQRKKSEEELRLLNETLETRIGERTAQLRETNQRLLDEIAERERAQAAFVQAQKMEAIGHLTGGIAHDFNNLLTAIQGNVDMIGRRSSDDRIRQMAGYARDAVDRAAKLTGQLLAFSRSQSLVLKPVEIDRLV
jgi:PAS domain S-box-containing protein